MSQACIPLRLPCRPPGRVSTRPGRAPRPQAGDLADFAVGGHPVRPGTWPVPSHLGEAACQEAEQRAKLSIVALRGCSKRGSVPTRGTGLRPGLGAAVPRAGADPHSAALGQGGRVRAGVRRDLFGDWWHQDQPANRDAYVRFRSCGLPWSRQPSGSRSMAVTGTPVATRREITHMPRKCGMHRVLSAVPRGGPVDRCPWAVL